MSKVVPLPSDEARRLEVHEHAFISGPRSRWAGADRSRLVHSHAGGHLPHKHPDTGPATFTIDKDEWLRATGLRGGGRKSYTAKPSGEQLPSLPLDKSQTEFEVVVCNPPPREAFGGEGAGLAPVARMVLSFGMTAVVKDGRDGAA